MTQAPPTASSARTLVVDALTAAYRNHQALGHEGLEEIKKNQFGDTALRGDVEAEATVLEVLRQSGVSFTVKSEEHGEIAIGHDDITRLLAVLDGIDGSAVYKKQYDTGLYGTLLALYGGPRYDDYLAAGIMLHATGQLLIAENGKGAQCIDMHTHDATMLHTNKAALTPDSIIFVDTYPDNTPDPAASLYDYFTGNHITFVQPLEAAGYTTRYTGSSASYYALLSMGEAAMIGESTRKGNLEYATAYPLVREAGGLVVQASNGEDIGPQLFLDYGQASHIPLVSIANTTVLQQLKDLSIVGAKNT